MQRFVGRLLAWMTGLGLALILVSTCEATDVVPFDDTSLEFFEKEVRPILKLRCYECHSSDLSSPKGGLRLDSRDGLIQGGDTGPAVKLEEPNESLIVSVINYGDTYQMPPKSKLPSSEIAVLTKWVEMGIPWPKDVSSSVGKLKPFDLATRMAQHWCWQPVKRTVVPSVRQTNWPITDVDPFILTTLESKGIQPAPQAEKRTLIRRLYFDLIGLPPSPDEVESFVRDPSPNSLEAVVDRLLNSVHFGERWGRHWLDLARFAETRGHEFEPIIPNAWQYRDYVIRALNADVPYDRFLTEQIAGDLIEPRWRVDAAPQATTSVPINEAPIGTGFWLLGEEVHSPVDIRKDETDRMDNRLDVLSKTFLGLTVACARCHDHKFDAISQKDYYALAGFAISGSYRQIRVDSAEQHRQLAVQLAEVRSQRRQQIAQSILDESKLVLENIAAYWLAARQAIEQGVLFSTSADRKTTSIVSGTAVVERLAAEDRLDRALLTRWCIEADIARKDKEHVLHDLFQADATRQPTQAKPSSDQSTAFTANGAEKPIPGLVVDFGDPTVRPTIQDGVSFGLQPVSRGSLILCGPDSSPQARIAVIGGWDRDLFWKNIRLAPGVEIDHGTLGTWQPYGRMVRSPDFALAAPKVWYLIRGSVRAYAVVNSHLIVVGPLHGGLLQQFESSDHEWRWVAHDLSHYNGHRLHIEFSPGNDGPCSIGMVVQSLEQPHGPELDTDWQHAIVSGEAPLTERIALFAKVFHTAAASIAKMPQSIERGPLVTAKIADWFVSHRSLFSSNVAETSIANFAQAEAELAKNVKWDSTLAPAMLDGNGVDEYLLIRGNSNSPKEPVARRFLEAFPRVDSPSFANDQLSADARLSDNSHPSGSGRLELAQEILRSPLAARVAVNRVWHHLFGRGIVPSVDNLGVLGQPPSHPELLDFLANQFVRENWSIKTMIRSLVLSRTYQMSSHPTEAETSDPNNELWHRMPMKRLEGEIIRDSMLMVSDSLNRTTFGPSIPVHLTEFMQGRGRPGTSGPLDGSGRRSIYVAVRRNFLSPMMMAFDTPSPFSTVGRRTVSNVPAQALILMNDPFVIEQANRWAEHLLADVSLSTEQRLDRIYLTAFARHATPAEVAEALRFLNDLNENRPENRREAWSHLCHILFNVKEFIFIE